MSTDKINKLIADYLYGSISDEDKNLLKQLLDDGEIDLIDFKANEKVYNDLSMINVPEPSSSLDQKFYTMLDEEIQNQRVGLIEWLNTVIENLRSQVTMPRLAYAFSFILIGVFVGYQSQNNTNGRANHRNG